MRFRAALVLAFTSSLAAHPDAPDSLDTLLQRMDRTAASFRSFSANLRSVAHTAVIDEDDVSTGEILLKRTNRGIDVLIAFTAPDPKFISLHSQKAEIYYPKMQTVEEYDISRYRALADQFLLIGFGTSGKELAASYSMKVLGAEEVAGVQATRLELVPKSAEVLKNLKKLELWIPASADYPVQQKFYLAAGDYRLATYTNVKRNPPLTDSDLKLRVPRDVKRVSPQK
ncbi:MAG TPA: outer membrane lipoprotein carrier protein LolA [Bryobacteraceae bacterium]|nr:outer membrane lipoprotein carrier protein LolA [Bryobacteraceae bacterium]